MIIEVYEKYESGKFTLVDEINTFSSVRWRRKFLEPGEIELHAVPTKRNIEAMKNGRILLRGDAEEGGIIRDVRITDDEIEVKGRMLSHILKDRVTYPMFRFSGNAEIGMQKLVQTYAINAIPMLKIGKTCGFTEKIEIQATGKDLMTALTAMAKASTIGFRIRPDVQSNTLWFETYKGADRTKTIEFCTENKNIENAAMEIHDGDFCNFAYVAGEGEGAARTIEIVDKTNGGYRRELWVDDRNTQKGDLTPEQYIALLHQHGIEKLKQCNVMKSFSADIMQRSGNEYKKDWDLGDIVSASREDWDAYTKDTITEIEEVFEGETGVPTVTPILGSGLPESINLED